MYSSQIEILDRPWSRASLALFTLDFKGYSCLGRATPILKKIVQGGSKGKNDPWLTFLDQRNTSIEGKNSSPVQRIRSRGICKLISVSANPLYPRVVKKKNAKEKLKIKRQMVKSYHDGSAKVLPARAWNEPGSWSGRIAKQRLGSRYLGSEAMIGSLISWRSQWKHTTPKQRSIEALVRYKKRLVRKKMLMKQCHLCLHWQEDQLSAPLKAIRTRRMRRPVRFKVYV